MTDDLVTVCIPTHRRPGLLRTALASCFAQTYRPLEIIVGDDSPERSTDRLIRGLDVPAGCTLVYRHNRPSLGQNANVNALFDIAKGRRLILLHDDDTLMPDAVECLLEASRRHPEVVIAFGKAEIMAADGSPLQRESAAVDRHFSRAPERAGLLPSLLEAAFLQIVPNNGYMIRSDVARAIRFRDEATAGVYCDTDFAIRVGLQHDVRAGVYVDRYLSRYRYSLEAVSVGKNSKTVSHPRAGLALYRFVKSLRVPSRYRPAKQFALERMADKAVKALAYQRQRREALQIYFSRDYPWRARLSGKGLYHLLLIAFPDVDTLRPYRSVRTQSDLI